MTTKKVSTESAVVDVWKRQVGELSTRDFARRRAASQNLVLHFDILRKLDKHQGCVNTVSFNAAGDILVSGADDRRVILWNWVTGKHKLSFYSGHHNNVFQAKFMPFTEDRSIVTCAADGQVRLAHIREGGTVETNLLAKHNRRAHKLVIEPGSSHVFYTCGEDGLVQRIDLRTGSATGHFTCNSGIKQGYSSSLGLYAISMGRNPNLFAVGGSDQFVRLYDNRCIRWDASAQFDRPVDFFCPPHLIDDDIMGITGLAFSDQNELLASYSNEFIYLFTKDMGLGPDFDFTSQGLNESDAVYTDRYEHTCSTPAGADDGNVKPAPQAYKGHSNCETVKGVNFFGPKSEYVVSGSDCGRIFIWKKKNGELIRVMEADKRIVNCIESHPHDTVLASSGIEQDVKIWVPKSIDRASLPVNAEKVTKRRNGYFLWGGFYADDESDDDFIDLDDDSDDDDDYDDTSDEDGDADEDGDHESDKMTDIDEMYSENDGSAGEQPEEDDCNGE